MERLPRGDRLMKSIHPLHLYNAVKWRALVGLARIHRRRLEGAPFIGITGSCAKTTTKTLLADILSGPYQVACNPGSKNRTITLADTMLKTQKDGVCIQEFGASGIGTLDAMIAFFKPTVAVVTTVMRDHYSAFRSMEAIAREKTKLVAALPADGIAVLNQDDPLVAGMRHATRARCITYGTGAGADIRAENLSAAWPAPLSGRVIIDRREYLLRTGLYGLHTATSAMAALAAAIALGLSPQDALAALEKVSPPPHRMQAAEDGRGVSFILDDFKASLDGIPAIIDFTAQSAAQRKIMIIGTLSDYPGSSSPKYRRVARQALSVADQVMLVGKFAAYGLKGQPTEVVNQRLFAFRHLVELNGYLQPRLRAGDLVILKGNRKQDHLERLFTARRKQIRCWQSECNRLEECPECPNFGTVYNPEPQQ
jgi:UDP-N-acetylmuramoyl-tripeptide--D-alanyl-D-alanine ligase